MHHHHLPSVKGHQLNFESMAFLPRVPFAWDTLALTYLPLVPWSFSWYNVTGGVKERKVSENTQSTNFVICSIQWFNTWFTNYIWSLIRINHYLKLNSLLPSFPDSKFHIVPIAGLISFETQSSKLALFPPCVLCLLGYTWKCIRRNLKCPYSPFCMTL